MQVSRGPAKLSESIVRWRHVYPISKLKVSTTTKENQCKGSFRIKTIRGWCVCTKWVWECGAVRIPPTILKKELRVRLIPAQSTMKFVIRLCASEVDRKSIHSDVYHEGRWLLWYWILSQIITMQSVHTPCRPPPAAETTLRNDLRIREYCMVIPFTIRMWFSKKASFSHWQTNKLNADIHDSRWISASFLCLK